MSYRINNSQLCLYFLCLPLLFLSAFSTVSFDDLVASSSRGNYSCQELERWLTLEKHYSNEKKKQLFSILHKQATGNQCSSVMRLSSIAFDSSSNSFLSLQDKEEKRKGKKVCSLQDENAILLLSNFSINNNYSHFLHALLRLFCAMIDSQFIFWKEGIFHHKENVSLWLDPNLKMDEKKNIWLSSFIDQDKRNNILRELSDVAKGDCVATRFLTYGSGCVYLLPPEKWMGYQGINTTFSTYVVSCSMIFLS